MIFKFGDDLESVKGKLYSKDYFLEKINWLNKIKKIYL
jgi:hypothetical protein